MNVLLTLLLSILKVFIPAVVKASDDTCQTASSRTVVAEKLRTKIHSTWGAALLILISFSMSGCFTRTIYIPHGVPVRLAAPIKDAPVWVLDKDKRPVKTTMTIPEGWFTLPMDKEEE